MNEPSRSLQANEIVQAYLAFGDYTRLISLPNWITIELNISQLKAIVLLEHYGVLTVSELARLLGIGKPAASILVQQLVEKELAERSEDATDRRRTFVRPTARVTALVASRREQIRTNLERLLRVMSEEDMASLHHGLAALLRIVEAEKARSEDRGHGETSGMGIRVSEDRKDSSSL